jgi:O-antigen ligase
LGLGDRPWILLPAFAGLFVAAAAWWTLGRPERWVWVFLGAAVLLPPLPLAWGDTGPHPATAVAILGFAAGLANLHAWRPGGGSLGAPVALLWFALCASVPWAAFYSGYSVAAASLARLALFSISIYLFFYVAGGPGRELRTAALLRFLFVSSAAASAFAAADFYFQFPAPSRFAPQFIWLSSGVYRRAQGLFYEASTLGLFCVFALVMAAAVAVRGGERELGLRRWQLVAVSVPLAVALVLSFSRTAMASCLLALAVMVWLERGRLRWFGKLLRPAGTLAAGSLLAAGLLGILLPNFVEAYLLRLWYTGAWFAEAPDLIFSHRLESWRRLWDYAGAHPGRLLFGVGYKTLPYAGLDGSPLIADNTYFSVLVETGLMGFVALLWLHLAVLRCTWRWATSNSTALGGLVGLGMFSFWCGLILQMLSGDTLTYWRVLPWLFAMLAAGLREAQRAGSGA